LKVNRRKMLTDYQNFIALSKYSRFREDLGRRENWNEIVDRYIEFFRDYLNIKTNSEIEEQLSIASNAIKNMEVVPSMRALKSAGKALKSHNVSVFNCAFVAIDNPHSFDEILYLSCCGVGNGFSVEQKYISKLPEIPEELHPTETIIQVGDSKIGWATSLRELISLLYAGKIPKWDVSKVRPYGAILKTFGGRASGPGPLVDLFEFVISIFKNATGRKLKPIEVLDIVTKIGLIAESGGTRRAALISLSDLDDTELRHAKTGNWWENNPQRAYANNSAVYNQKPELGKFIEEWLALYRSKSGERGIFNLSGLKNIKYRNDRRDWEKVCGVNPCGEILLRNASFCNLSEVIVKPNDTFETLKEKVKIATFLGTIQSTLTKFKYIRKIWQKNCEEERLLGVSLTGICDNPLLIDENVGPEILNKLKEECIKTNIFWSKYLGINPSVAITTGKPSGNTSQLTNSSSGIHPRHSPFYIRTVRMDKKDPLTRLMIDQGFPHEDCVMKPETTVIFSFPIKSPEGSVFRNNFTAIQQLELWKRIKNSWAEHNMSITVYIKEHEWLDVASWIYKNFEHIGGVTFLPYDGGQYKQAPYQECTEEFYKEFKKKMPINVDWSKISEYELEDQTTSSREGACSGGVCEL
jgi:ribonucleoside-triphosphate reductase